MRKKEMKEKLDTLEKSLYDLENKVKWLEKLVEEHSASIEVAKDNVATTKREDELARRRKWLNGEA